MTFPGLPKLRRPRRSAENIVASVALVLGLLALAVGFTTPVAHTIESAGAYDQTGSFTYSSTVDRPSAAYPDGVATTGMPIFLSTFTTLDVGFAYRFASPLAHRMAGTIGLEAVLSSTSSSWRRTFVLRQPTRFTGDLARVRGTVDLHALRALTEQLAIDTGTPATGYDWTLVPTVHVRGVVATRQIHSAFAPTLPFTFSNTVLALNAPAPAAPSTASAATTALEPALAGSLPVRAPNSVMVVKLRIAVSVLRGLGLGVVGLALLGLCTKPLRRKRTLWSHEQRIAHRLGCVLVDVASLDQAMAASAPPTAMPDFASLAQLAHTLERPILHDVAVGAYATQDDGRLYVFRPSNAQPTSAALPARARTVKAPRAEARPGRRRRRVVSVIAVVFGCAVAAGLITSFTAANTVPLSRAGVSKWPIDDNQLASPYCASLVLTNTVIATGSTVTGTSANDLVLGRNSTGTQRLNGGSGDDCIIAGGTTSSTTNTIDGGPGTDICIGAQGAKNTYANCEYSGSPPATMPAAVRGVSFSDWQNVSGSALNSIPTGTAATSTSALDLMETPTNRGDNLGSRLQALLTAPTTGTYTFWMASDDNGRLYLSTDSDPANRQMIASVASYTNPEAWDTFPSQQSSQIALVAGQQYFIEAWAKESGGGDNLGVAWSGPGITRQVITGDYLTQTTSGCAGWCPAAAVTPYHAQLTSFAGKCADVLNAVTADGSPVGDYSCNSGTNQTWTLASDTSLQVYANPAKCLTTKGGGLSAGTGVVISTCTTATSQDWTYSSASGQLTLGGLCLEVPGASPADGVQLAINTCNGQPEQYWAFVAGATYTPDPPALLSVSTSTISGTACPDCTVKLYKSTGSVGAAGPASTLLGTTTASATGTFSYAPGGALSVGTNVTATATTPLAVVSSPAANVRSR